eukprot:m.151611 g.151611  ORF g.151611 m.151611 type:complete len:215 (-) comp10154_c0_seq1:2850-3494(-)
MCVHNVQQLTFNVVTMKELIPHNSILVGHSLENDFKALKLVHEHVIDTSVLFRGKRSAKFKHSLRHLTQKYLDRSIQAGDAGHNSIEDAKAAMELVLAKLEKGAEFGEARSEESLFSRMDLVQKRTVFLGDTSNISSFVAETACSVVPCAAAQQIATEFNSDYVRKHDLIVAQLSEPGNLIRAGAPSLRLLNMLPPKLCSSSVCRTPRRASCSS